MNFTGINLDLQGLQKRIYANLLYQSQFYKMLNRDNLEIVRSTGTPIIEVVKGTDTPLNVRNNVEIGQGGLTNTLAKYNSVKVDLTELAMDYSFRISPLATTSLENAVRQQLDLKDAQVAHQIDVYGFGKLNETIIGPEDGSMAYTEGQIEQWAPTNGTETIEAITHLKSVMFDRNIYDGYILALSSVAYSQLIAQLVSILKYETRTGVEAVDEGEVAQAYGVYIFQVNSNVIEKNPDGSKTNVVGYFGHEIATVGDTFFSSMTQYLGNYPGFPGYYVLEGNILFGAQVVRSEALIKLVESIPTVDDGSFDEGTLNTEYAQVTAFKGTNVAKFIASGLPTGLSINEATGAVTGTPSVAGSFPVSIYGVDAYGNYSNAFSGTIEIKEA